MHSNDKIPTGEEVAQHLTPTSEYLDSVPVERIQPNGVDLGIDKVERMSGIADFRGDGYSKPERTRIKPKSEPHSTTVPYYDLTTGRYAITYDTEFDIPVNYTAHVYPRSRLMRSGMHMTTALWDPGYNGIGEGQLIIPQSLQRAKIPVTMKLAQMVFIPAKIGELRYDGSHQGEGLETDEGGEDERPDDHVPVWERNVNAGVNDGDE